MINMLQSDFWGRGRAPKLSLKQVIFVQYYILSRKIFNKVNYLLYLQRFGNEIETDNSVTLT